MNKELIDKIQSHYDTVESKRPFSTNDRLYYVQCILKVAKAINDSNKHHIKEELLNTIAVCVNMLEEINKEKLCIK
ncbi:MAG: hypothetical protein ACRC0A_07790 [Chitinophagaceae bacterium]